MDNNLTVYFVSIVFFILLLIGSTAFFFFRWKNTSEINLLKVEQQRSQQLSLLEEAGRIIADSFDEKVILQRAVEVIIKRFGLAEAAICKLIESNMLEVAAIDGTAQIGYEPGFQQKVGVGIIGHTAEIRKTYVTNHVANDPYYFSNLKLNGSVICTPIFKAEKLFGVLYVESEKSDAFDKFDVKTMETLAMQIASSLHRAHLYAETQENLRVLSIIQNISKVITSSLDQTTISNQVLLALQEAFGYTHMSIYTLDNDYLNIVTEIGYENKDMVFNKIHISQGVHGRAIRTKAVQFIEDTRKDDVYLTADTSITSEICIPLLKEENPIGTINVESDETRKLTNSDVNILTTIASSLAIALDNARLHERITEMAITDAVTGLSNRHVFEQSLTAEIERAQRLGMNVSLIVFDIDSFKEFNDKYGHPAGDARLKGMADIIKNNLRKYDIAARYGGDEFAIILSDSNEKNALNFAKRLHHAAQIGAPPNPSGYSLSIGVATFPQDAMSDTELLLAADNAAMLAKQLGKNQIRLASETDQ